MFVEARAIDARLRLSGEPNAIESEYTGRAHQSKIEFTSIHSRFELWLLAFANSLLHLLHVYGVGAELQSGDYLEQELADRGLRRTGADHTVKKNHIVFGDYSQIHLGLRVGVLELFR